ncbi:PIN domain-containing protein [Candidatus Bipolaricaulota bacterium]|nr:PIN domain-containing protein [Candidatus Bipolaricaulota bacterium]
MIFIDSWVWIEYFSKDERWREAENVLKKLEEEKGIVSSLVLAEVRYRILRKFDAEKADRVLNAIENFDNLQIVPVTAEVAKYGADIRDKYYRRGEKELSYADAIHLSTAILVNCEELYSGDPDFLDIEEIKTKVI